MHVKERFILQPFYVSVLLIYPMSTCSGRKKLETAGREWQWSSLHTWLADKDAWASRHHRLSCLASMQRTDCQMRALRVCNKVLMIEAHGSDGDGAGKVGWRGRARAKSPRSQPCSKEGAQGSLKHSHISPVWLPTQKASVASEYWLEKEWQPKWLAHFLRG